MNGNASNKLTKDAKVFEIMQIILILGMTALFVAMGPHRVVVLNLFYAPIILTGYFLGRTHAGTLAVFCVLSVTIVTTLVPRSMAAFETPIMVGLALTVWAAVLGLCAILMGTLCDQRAATVTELHRAYVGVVEVLSKYLQGGNVHGKTRSSRIAELSQTVAEELRLPRKAVDDVRVAALLYELGNVEVTTQVISRAMGTLEGGPQRHTFAGTDLVQSLGSVLEGALPLLVNQDDAAREYLVAAGTPRDGQTPMGARIIRAVRAYDELSAGAAGDHGRTPRKALEALRADQEGGHDANVISAIERVVQREESRSPLEPTLL